MRILGPIVLPSPAHMAALNPEIAGGSAIRPQIVGDQTVGNEAVFLQKFAHQFQRSVLVSLALDQNFEDFALSVDGAPKIDHAAGDFQIDFIQMPGRVRSGAALAQIRRDHRPEMIHPTPNGLVGDRDAAFRQQIFDVAEAQGEPEIKPDRLLNDLGREAIPAVADFLHSLGYRAARGTASPTRRDNAVRTAPCNGPSAASRSISSPATRRRTTRRAMVWAECGTLSNNEATPAV